MSDHIEHACTNCGSLLHHANRCDKPLQRNPDATPQPAEPPAGAAEDEDTNKKPDIMGWMDVLRPTPPPQPQENQRVETPAAETAEANASVIGSCAGSSPASLQPQGGTPRTKAAVWVTERDPATGEGIRVVSENFAIDLETALAAAQAEVEALRKERPSEALLADLKSALESASAKENASLRAELEQTRRELEKTKARLETYWKKGDEDFATLVALRQTLTAAEQRAEGLSALNQAHAEHLAAARADLDRVAGERDTALQRAEGAEALVAEYKTECGCPLCKRLTAQRDTAIRERDEAKDDSALLDAYEEMCRECCRPCLAYDPDKGFQGWDFDRTRYPSLREAVRAALAAKTTEGGV